MIYIDGIIFSLQYAGGISLLFFELLSRISLNRKLKIYLLEYSYGLNSNIFRNSISFQCDVLSKKSIINITRYFDAKIYCDSIFIFHSSYYRICTNKNAINITTVHDFTYEYFGTGLRRFVHSWQKNRAIRKSDYIICISESTKRDLLKFLPDVDPSKIRVIYNGVSEDYHILPALSQEMIPFDIQSYVLFVGARSGYKNFKLAVEAIANTTLNLLIIGSPLSDKEKAFLDDRLGKERYVVMSGIENSELNIYYNGAYCLLYPSAYEGFGLPVVEAQRAGCPVIAYNASSIPEIIGNTPLLLSDLSVESILKALDILADPLQRNQIIQEGLQNSKRFSWDKMCNEVVQLYQEALDTHSVKNVK